MKLIVGLGNPGREYAYNRHNVGFTCVNYFAKVHGIRFTKKQGQARIGIGEISGIEVVVARPQTYMNLSGESVSRLVNKLKVSLDDLIVVHDDLDLPLGKIRIRQGGSSAGHKGINSIITCLGSDNFIRIRIGIGRPATSDNSSKRSEPDIIAYVLSNFTAQQRSILADLMTRVNEAILCLISEGLNVAMNKYNQGIVANEDK